MKCNICGMENLDGAAYCEDCGTQLKSGGAPAAEAAPAPAEEAPEAPAQPAAPAQGGISCPACGAENPAESKFCDDCGANLEAAEGEDVVGEVEDMEAEEIEEEPPETPTGVAKLVSEGSGVEFLLDKDVINIGRQSPADGIFPDIDLTDLDKDAYISRKHARILRKDDGFIFEDMGSSNGSFINNVRIAQGVQQFLNEGDTIRLGKTVMTLVKG
ncbi:MAG: FHA domain-containing protein [Firmicutes bacterium]|nr:FHA domain-containing protein [Bacillota bacterium]